MKIGEMRKQFSNSMTNLMIEVQKEVGIVANIDSGKEKELKKSSEKGKEKAVPARVRYQ